MYRCPHCAAGLLAEPDRYCCPTGHSFDRSREGYVNLLAGRRSRRIAGDSPTMVQARRRFLDAGFYAPLRDLVLGQLGPGSVLDVGCGEGYYSRPLAGASGREWVGALDVSKEAVRLAARRERRIAYAVANAFDLPLPDQVIDNALIVFGPLSAHQLARVLTPDGAAVVAGPGPRHLIELKRQLFPDAERHLFRVPLQGDPNFEETGILRLSYRMELFQPLLGDLADMTPYRWQVPGHPDQPLGDLEGLKVTADFLVGKFYRRDQGPEGSDG